MTHWEWLLLVSLIMEDGHSIHMQEKYFDLEQCQMRREYVMGEYRRLHDPDATGVNLQIESECKAVRATPRTPD